MRNALIWSLIIVQLILAVFLIRIIVRMAMLTFLHKQTLPYVPVSRKHIALMVESGVLKNVKTIVDLGCGDGVMLSRIQKAYPHAQYEGVEINWALVLASRLRFALTRRHVPVKRGDMFAYPVNNVDAIIGWWIADLTPRLVEKFVAECKPGCVILSAMFSLPPHPQLRAQEVRKGNYSVFIYHKV
jgi:SAM-dependent methyltransferase